MRAEPEWAVLLAWLPVEVEQEVGAEKVAEASAAVGRRMVGAGRSEVLVEWRCPCEQYFAGW